MNAQPITPQAALAASRQEEEDYYDAAVKTINERLCRDFRGPRVFLPLEIAHFTVRDRVAAAFRNAGWDVAFAKDGVTTVMSFSRSRPAASL